MGGRAAKVLCVGPHGRLDASCAERHAGDILIYYMQ